MFALLACSLSATTKPHIVYLLVDDLGYANVGYNSKTHGPTDPMTPNIDNLFTDGVELASYYTYKFCSPTRSAFMSGRLPYHVNSQNHPPASPAGGVPLGMTTLADQLHGAGYDTHQIGKWHCGMSSRDRLPVARGFDSSFGYLSGAEDHFLQTRSKYVDFWRNTLPAIGENGNTSTGMAPHGDETAYGAYQYTKEGLRIIEAKGAEVAAAQVQAQSVSTTAVVGDIKPMFIYYAWQIMHGPTQAPTACVAKFPDTMFNPRRLCNGMMSAVDDAIGKVVAGLKTANLYNDTLIIFSSDNGGPADHANNWPLRGTKGSDFEGGVRVAAFLSGGWHDFKSMPKITGLMHIADWWATLSSMVGAPMVDSKAAASKVPGGLPPIDSLDMSAMITGANITSPRTELMLSSLGEHEGSGAGFITTIAGVKWKLIRGSQGNGVFPAPQMPNKSTTNEPDDCTTGCLFNLDSDPVEHFDLAKSSSHSSLLATLMARVIALDATSFQSNGSSNSDKAAITAAKARSGFWGPWRPNGSDTGRMPSPAPTPGPGPSPGPVPPSPPGSGVYLKFTNKVNPAPLACLTFSKVTPDDVTRYENSNSVKDTKDAKWLAKLGMCDSNSKWLDVNTAIRTAGSGSPKTKVYLRQSPSSNCTAGNTVQMGIAGGKGDIVTRLTPDGTLQEVSCGSSLCVGMGAGKGELALVSCAGDAAKGWATSSYALCDDCE